MSIIITINSETAAEAQAQILDLSAVMGGNPIRSAAASVEAPKEGKQARNRATPKTDKEPENEKEDTQPVDPDGDVDGDSENAGDGAPIPTVVELRAKANELGAAKRSKVKELLDEFEVPNITAVPEERRAEFMGRLEKL